MKEDLDFYEKMIYEWAKEEVQNINQLRKKYKQYEGLVDYQKIYRCIVNYRIEKYGTSSIVQYRGISKQDAYKINENARNRRRKKRIREQYY